MDETFVFIFGLPMFVRAILAVIAAVWAFEMFCLPFNINRLIARLDKIYKALEEILKLVGNDSSIRADNSKVLSLILGDVLEDREKARKKERESRK